MTPSNNTELKRSIGLVGATGVGVGAIVGGGILALAGIAFKVTGPSAMLAFLLNGLIAIITACSYAEMSALFPVSGGTYTFSKKVLSVPAAFMVGWVVWFASILASVLYALGFAYYAAAAVNRIFIYLPAWCQVPGLTGKNGIISIALLSIIAYSFGLIRKSTGGGQLATWGKIFVFGFIIVAGLWFLKGQTATSLGTELTPFFVNGPIGLFQAMGFTFIALQGFDIISVVAGEVRSPEKTIPRAMFISLGIALIIYIPLLFIISTVGTGPGKSIVDLSMQHPETVIPRAVQNYLGRGGYWLVMVAAILAMLSALRANLLAASRVVLAMANDRTLPRHLGIIGEKYGTPGPAILLSGCMILVIIFVVGNVNAAGAAASLIFLISFALTQWTAITARMRVGAEAFPFRTPWFPYPQVIGTITCAALAIYQGIQVPLAGLIMLVWLGFGGILYLFIFAQHARIKDEFAATLDPQVFLLRGQSPLVLVPMANPTHAHSMVELANTLTPPKIGRVLLLSIVVPPPHWQNGEPFRKLIDSQAVLKEALTTSFSTGLSPEALTTIAANPWHEISRVSRTHRCESLLLGMGDLEDPDALKELENLMSQVTSNVIVLRAPDGFEISSVKKVLVPLGGQGQQDRLRARLLGSLYNNGTREITFLRVLPEDTPPKSIQKARNWLEEMVQDEVAGEALIEIICSNQRAERIIERAANVDLLILGLQRFARQKKSLGDMVLRIARQTSCGLILISRKG